jgi:hypothetical protein
MEKGMAMRTPVLIAETPFADGHGPRFLAPPGRRVDRDVAAHYVGLIREEADDVEEIEGDDYLAVRLQKTDDSTGETAAEIMVLAGIDVDRLTGEERDEVLEQLRERLEVLGDAVAAVDWTLHEHDVVLEIPELEEWHEPGWDVLPRAGVWADPQHDPNPTSHHEEPAAPETREPEPIDEPKPVAEETPIEESRVFIDLPKPSDREGSPGQVTVLVQIMSEPPTTSPPDPVPDVIVKANEPPEPIAPAPAPSLTLSRAIDPGYVSASVDRSLALSPLPAKLAENSPTARRGLRWWVWFPWTAVVVLLTAKVLYLTQFDRTWNQRVTEVQYARGATRVVEKPVDRVVEKIVEKPVDRIVEKRVEVPVEKLVPTADNQSQDQWAKFATEYQARMSRNDVVAAADWLVASKAQLPAWGESEPPGLPGLIADYRARASKGMLDAATGRRSEHRFADALDCVGLFASSKSVAGLLGLTAPPVALSQVRAEIHTAADEYHYSQIRALSTMEPVPEDRLQQHMDAYLRLVEPPGRMLADVRRLSDYSKWIKEGRPAKALVRIEWGPRTQTGMHAVEIGLAVGKDGQPAKSFTRTIDAAPGRAWSESFPIAGVSGTAGQVPYRVKTVRAASPIEELAEGVRDRAELFLRDRSGPVSAASEADSGTRVVVECQGVLDRPILPAWKSLASLEK